MQADENQLHHHPNDDADRRLWQQARQAPAGVGLPEPADLDPNDLAAYLDGRADPALVQRIEQRLAVDRQCLETVIELRQIGAGPSRGTGPDVAVPAAVTSAAKRLVGPVSDGNKAAAWPLKINWSRLQWAAAAVFILTAGWGGYRTGLNAYPTDTLTDTTTPALVFDLEGTMDEPSVSLVDIVTGGQP